MAIRTAAKILKRTPTAEQDGEAKSVVKERSVGLSLFDEDDALVAMALKTQSEAAFPGAAITFSDSPVRDSESGPAARTFGKDEMNLAEFPFAVLARRVAPGQKTIEVIQEGRDTDGRSVRQEWLVTGSDAFGLPTAADDEVYVALMKLLRDNRFRERTVRFTIAQLLRTMQSSTGKRDYERIAASLDRLTGVTLRSKNAFWDHARKRYVTEAFHLLDSYRISTGSASRGDTPGAGRELSEVTFSNFLFGSIQSGYVKNLDVDFYFSLSTPLARRYYRLLDKHRYRGRIYEIELRRLAAKLPLMDKFESQLKRRLDPVFEEFKTRGFLQSAEYRPGVGGTTVVRVCFAGSVLPPAPETAPLGVVALLPAAEPEPDPTAALAARLKDAGVNRADADRLAREHPDESRRQLEFLPYVKEFTRGPGAYLRTAIEQGFAPPPAWVEEKARAESRGKKAAAVKAAAIPDPAAVAQAERLREEIVRLKRDEPETWSAMTGLAAASLPPPIRSRPDGPAFRPALEAAIERIVSERLAGG